MVDSEDRGFPELANLIDERFNRQGVGKPGARGAFYERCAQAELDYFQQLAADSNRERQTKGKRRLREIQKRQTAGRDYWRQTVRQMLRPASVVGRGERRPGEVSGPVMALALDLPLEVFAARVGMTVEQIMSPPRIARVDLAQARGRARRP